MDKHLAKKVNIVLYNDSWQFFEQYLQQELDRAYVKFDSAKEPKDFYSVQSEIRVLKSFLNLKESTRQSLEN
jgi:hypothetical protein